MSFLTTPWSGRRYFLDKMTLRELVWAYAVVVHPLAWHMLHRFVLFGRFPRAARLSGPVPGAPVTRRARAE